MFFKFYEDINFCWNDQNFDNHKTSRKIFYYVENVKKKKNLKKIINLTESVCHIHSNCNIGGRDLTGSMKLYIKKRRNLPREITISDCS